MSEANKEQAERCAETGIQAMRSGDTAKAIRMLEKSLRMYDNPRVRQLLEQLQSPDESPQDSIPSASPSATPRSTTQSTDENASARSMPSSSGVRQRRASSDHGGGRAYTPEQVEMVKRVKQARDYYEVLGLEKGADADAVKKAYRKVAVKLHPDKNPAPGAEEAFKRVNAAFTILSDADKRAHYDHYGEENGHATDPSHSQRAAHYARYEQDLSPEDIFNMFFGFGGGGGATFVQTADGRIFRQMHRRHQYAEEQQPDANRAQQQRMAQLLQLLPIILLVLMTLFSFGSTQDEKLYSLQPDDSFTVERSTVMYTRGLPYYVKPSFQKKYGSDRHTVMRVEQAVESELYYSLTKQCASETQRRNVLEQKLQYASGQHREKLKNNLAKLDSPSCDALHKYFPRSG